MLRLVSYTHRGLPQWGALSGDGRAVLSAYDLEEVYSVFLGSTLAEFIETGEEGLLSLVQALSQNEKEAEVSSVPLSEIEINIPFWPRRNIFCVGKNYKEHVREFEKNEAAKDPVDPIFFTKATTSVIGPEEAIDSHPDVTREVDYEGELAVIIGKQGTDIAPEDAADYIYGYTILNDVTARDLQRKHAQWFLGKSLDTFCPIGPFVLVGARAEPFTLYTRVNGNLRQEGNTEDLIFSIQKLISVLSRGMTLLPGDVIATGTPKGVGMGQNPPTFLQKGDVVEITIDAIGTLRNTVK